MSPVEPPDSGEVLRTVVDDQPVAVWNVDGCLHAIGDVCPHSGWILSEGTLERQVDGTVCVVCPGHHRRFDLETGESQVTPERVEVFAVERVDGGIEVRTKDPGSAANVPGPQRH